MHDQKLESANSRAEARSELEDYFQASERQHALFPKAALVGICAGAVAVLFRFLLSSGDNLRNLLIQWSHQWSVLGWIFPVAFGAAGAAVSVFLVEHYAPEASGSGIPHLKAVLHRLRSLAWFPVLAVKLIGGSIAIGTGLALGREGPTVQMGGAIGDGLSRWLRVSTPDRLTLIAAGAGAGLTGAFNAPLSGLIFVLEEIQRDFRAAVFGAAFIAAASADVITRLAAGQLPVFNVPNYPVPPLAALPAFALLGCVTGVFGIAFNRGLLFALDWIAPLRDRLGLAPAAFIGAITGLVAWFYPLGVGGGHDLAEIVLGGALRLAIIPMFFVLRFGLTVFGYGCGAPGGIFSPLLVLGALIGLAVGQLSHFLSAAVVPEPAIFAVVGMAAYFTAIVRAPLTGIVLILEMTGNYEQMLPLLVSCFCAYLVAESLKDVPIYEALLERDLLRGGLAHKLEEPIIVEFEVEAGSPFAGRQVRDLGLPAGCVLVRYSSDHHESVPTATTLLAPYSRITVVIQPDASGALALLRRGCRASVEQ